MTEERSKYIQNCTKRELEVRASIINARLEVKRLKRGLRITKALIGEEFEDCKLLITEAHFLDLIRIGKIELTALKKLLPDIKVRRSDGVLIVEDVMWKNFFKKYFNKCKNEDEILEMNYELCNAVKAAAKARINKLYGHKSL